ncbi:unnamed protein product [Nippostrongylus brasiliensis]|uniref:tRNA-intron lyase n=1 Tax=Nippostrongylus brasiliensis TaxID=27835 RepID=A0A158QY99_NIPBR|nr:unnamed protein product [Nippostrongylus brasiliensis]
MLDYIKQVFITGDVSCMGEQDDVLRRWAAEVSKEIAEQKPEFAIVHVQGLLEANDPDYVARVILSGIIDIPGINRHFDASVAFFDTKITGLGNLYLFRDASAVQHFDRYLNTGYRQRDDGTRDLSNQRTGFLLTRFRIHGREMTFVNVNLHSVPFEDVNEIAEQPQNVTTVQRERFDLHSIHDWFFRLGRGQMVKKYNGELAPVSFKGHLKEESVFFQPSRHYEINEESGKEEFMRTLCPSWADRILYNERMDSLFRHDSFCASGLYYGLVGEDVYIGQHKPVALHATICLK